MLFDVASLEIRTRARMTFPIANFFSNIGWYCKYVFGVGYMLNLASMICLLDAFFRQIKSFRRFRLAFVFGLQTYYLIDFSKISVAAQNILKLSMNLFIIL